MIRMYYIQELEKLPQYDKKILVKYRYYGLKKIFIREFPDAYLHDPYND
jgi:hypothetical protein